MDAQVESATVADAVANEAGMVKLAVRDVNASTPSVPAAPGAPSAPAGPGIWVEVESAHEVAQQSVGLTVAGNDADIYNLNYAVHRVRSSRNCIATDAR